MYGTNFGFTGVVAVSSAAGGNASNGLSNDPFNSDTVLGQNFGVFPATPAKLLEDRYIPLNTFGIILWGDLTPGGNQEFIQMFGSFINMFGDGASGSAPSMSFNEISAGGQFSVGREIGRGQITGGAGALQMFFFDNLQVLLSDIGLQAPFLPNALFQVEGQIGARTGIIAPRVRTNNGGNVNLADPDDNNTLITNAGGVVMANRVLPAITLSNLGYTAIVSNNNVNGVSIVASGGDVITFAGMPVTGAATASSTDIGAVARVTAVSAGQWYAEYYTGTWS